MYLLDPPRGDVATALGSFEDIVCVNRGEAR